MKIIYKKNIEKQTLNNNFYRKVIYTTPQQQLVLMSIPPGQEIGMEKHSKTTQFIRIESGKGIAKIADRKFLLKDGDAVIIPPNTLHNIISTGTQPLKLYTIYSPPEHPSQ
jgi:mannose-6-phosphate isomerase-like protein (cupin superfamily)